MNKFRISFISTIIMVFIFFTNGCNINEYTPTPDSILKSFPELLVNPDEIVGIYGHADIGATIFSYQSSSDNVLETILIQAKGKGWTVNWEKDTEIDLFQKINAKTTNVKKVRIYHNKKREHICVAWIWIDSPSELNAYEGKWAAEYYWPKYEQCKKITETH